MAHIEMTEEQAVFQNMEVLKLLRHACSVFNLIAPNVCVYNTFENSHLWLKKTFKPGSMLWIIHPSTKQFYRARVKKEIGEYAAALVAECKQGTAGVFLLQNLWKYHPFFVFMVAPQQYQDQVERALSLSYRRAHTVRHHSESEVFSVVECRANYNFQWSIIVQGALEGREQEIADLANRSVKHAVDVYNNSLENMQRTGPLLIPTPLLFNLDNCQYQQVERLTRKQTHSRNLILHENNRNKLKEFLWLFLYPVKSNPPKPMFNQPVKTNQDSQLLAVPRYSAPSQPKAKFAPNPRVKMILCQSSNGVIGFQNKLHPQLRCAADLKHFAETTKGHIVVMGRKTWESLPDTYKPLKDRVNVVVTRNLGYNPGGKGLIVHHSLRRAVEEMLVHYIDKDLFIIGGCEIYREAIEDNLVSEVVVSVADKVIPNTPFDGNKIFNVLPYLNFPHKSVALETTEGDTTTVVAHWARVKL